MHARFLPALVLACLLLTTVVVPAGAAGSSSSFDVGPARSIEARLAQLLDRDRALRGLPALRRDGGVDNVARAWAATMALDGRPSHRPDLTAPFTGAWLRVGENVGVGTSADAIHAAFVDSPSHRATMRGDWDHVGIGVALRGTDVWVAVNFVAGDPSVGSAYRRDPLWGRYALGAGGGGPFGDTSSSVHRGDVATLNSWGAAVSCATARFCPDESLRRAEVAAMLVRALGLPPALERFDDVASDHPYAAEIGALAAAGITVGCNPPTNDRFCPEDTVTRAQMASFLVRALDLDRRSARPFRDVGSSNVHAGDIAAIAAAGVTRGCNPPTNDRYCPWDDVTRGQMASFLVRGLS